MALEAQSEGECPIYSITVQCMIQLLYEFMTFAIVKSLFVYTCKTSHEVI